MTSKIDAAVSLNANATVNVDAKKSQALIVILGVVFGLLCFFGSVLIYFDKPLSWMPFLAAAITLAACVYLVILTHKNTDLAGAHPTLIEVDGVGGFKFITDPRVEVASKTLAPIVTILANMRSLPPASGLVDKELNPILGSEKEAIAKVDGINLAAQKSCNDTYNDLTQNPVAEAISAPVVDIPESEVSNLIPQEYTPSPES